MLPYISKSNLKTIQKKKFSKKKPSKKVLSNDRSLPKKETSPSLWPTSIVLDQGDEPMNYEQNKKGTKSTMLKTKAKIVKTTSTSNWPSLVLDSENSPNLSPRFRMGEAEDEREDTAERTDRGNMRDDAIEQRDPSSNGHIEPPSSSGSKPSRYPRLSFSDSLESDDDDDTLDSFESTFDDDDDDDSTLFLYHASVPLREAKTNKFAEIFWYLTTQCYSAGDGDMP